MRPLPSDVVHLDPDVRAVVRTKIGHESVPVRDLLPYVFDWRAIEPDVPQTLYVWEGYLADVRAGRKTSTIRVDDPASPGAASWSSTMTNTLPAESTIGKLTEEAARQDGFADLAELHRALRMHYPGIEDDTPTDIVHFRLADQQRPR